MPPYLQVTCVNPSLLLKIFSKNVGDLDSLLQNTTVGNSLGKLRTSASVLVFLEVDVVGDIIPIPVRPTCRVDNIAQVAVLEDDAGIGAPWATQICRALARCPGDRGLVEDVEGGAVVGLAPAGGDVSRPDRLDVAALEPRLGVAAEDVVDGAVDVAVGVELAALVAKDCVLVAYSMRQYRVKCSCRLRCIFSPVKLTP